jgi:glycyl-tRNA synthetase beta chain
VRPLQGIVALLGDDVVPCAIDGIVSGSATMGHRFHHKGPVTIGNAGDYAAKLRAAHVIVDQDERRATIRDRAQALCAERGLTWIADEALVVENSGLTEWPVPLLGDFDPAFLEVPPEVIRLTLATNQKYFVCADADGKLAPAFICTANIEAKDGGEAIIAGNRKVLAARLSDARFFWTQDKKTALADHAKKLERITFHEKLGTVLQRQERFVALTNDFQGQLASSIPSAKEACAVLKSDKVERVAKLAEWLASEGIVPNCDPVLARQAAQLCKADLVTEMVGEFPELQGVMGGYYARAEGLPDAVAEAIRDHYKPVGQGDDVPTAPVTVAVSLADKLDTLFGFFGEGLLPTGSKDPFALRRAAIATIRLVEANSLRAYVSEIARHWTGDVTTGPGLAVEDFMHDRLGVMMKEDNVRYDVVQASSQLGTRSDGDLWRVRRRAEALQAFIGTEDGVNLLAGYKRAANILKKEGAPADAATALTYTPEPAEAALIAALDASEPRAAAAVAEERFEDAMAALATLRAPIDQFFDDVTVNDSDENKRAARLGLLARLTAAVNGIADFSKVEG